MASICPFLTNLWFTKALSGMHAGVIARMHGTGMAHCPSVGAMDFMQARHAFMLARRVTGRPTDRPEQV